LTRDSIDEGFPQEIAVYANDSLTGVLCYFRICDTSDICSTDREYGDSIYAKDILITSDLTEYKPRKLKIFCTKK
jgi:hypothetical protein